MREPFNDRWSPGIANALEHRRLFLLEPYAMIVGLIAYMIWPQLPDFWPTMAAGAGLVVALALTRSRLVTFRITALALCVWFSFALLAIHGALFGTAMLARRALRRIRDARR